jgi:hypothetical protein
MKDPKNADKTVDELLELVSKNLAKDRLHYVKDGQFGVKGLGYTEDAPGLGTGSKITGKYISSGYGDLKENYEINKPKGPQNDAFNILLKKYSKDQIETTWKENRDKIQQYYNNLNKANRGTMNVAQELANFIDKKINENKNTMIKLMDLFEGEDRYYIPEKKEKKKPMAEKKKVKKSAIADRVKQIEEESIFNAMEGKIQAMAEEIEMRENKLSMIDENEDLQEFINPVRIKEMQKEIDELKKTKLKMENEYEKKSKGIKTKEVIDETETEEGY